MKIIKQDFPDRGLPTEGLRPITATDQRLFGTIRLIEPSRAMLVLRLSEDDREQVIYWLPTTRFLHNGTDVNPHALHDGQQISVRFTSDGGMKFANEIDIVQGRPAVAVVAEATAALRRSLWPSRSEGQVRK